ncbi:MAG: pitrilysin family protein [Chloroflexota bacterium]|nr:pitrilysin family protein [Chloroflexota bacterium]
MFQQATLSNGLRIITSAMPHTRSVTLGFLVGGGSRYESDPEAGAFHFVEHLCFKGTPSRPTPRIVSETMDRVGGLMNATTAREVTTYWCKVARPHFDIAADLIVDMVRNPLFDPNELEKERGVILEELAASRDHPDSRAGLLIDQTMWPDQPLGRDVGGTAESVKALTRDAMLRLVNHQYVPSNAVISVAGNIDHDEIVAWFERSMGDWPVGEPLDLYPAVLDQQAPRVNVELRKSEQAHICLGFHGVPSEHPQRYAYDMLSSVLGEGMSSRLFLELREERGLAYEAHSSTAHYRDAGAMEVYAAVDPRNAALALETILAELAKLKDGVPEDELHKAKEYAKGRMLMRMEDTRNVALWLGSQRLMRERVMNVDDVVARVDAVSPEDLQLAAREMLVPQNLNLAIVGPFRNPARIQRLVDSASLN